jgi:hypothetical protein
MAVFPKLVPSGYAGDYTDFFRTKVDREGAVRLITGTISVTSGTTIGSYIGLAPFNKGAKLAAGASQIYSPILDSGTGLTYSVGYLYTDSSSAGANAASNSSAYSSSDSHGQVGGYISFTNSTLGSTGGAIGLPNTAAGDGWFVVQVGTASTPTNQAAASLTFSLAVAYDPSGITN